MSTYTVQVVGDVFSPVMQPVRNCVETLVKDGGAVVHFAKALPEACARAFAEAWFPDVVLICQHWSDEFTEQDVRRLLTAFPLARIACCYGPWCESDGRTRDVWPLSVRVPVRCAAGRIAREFEVLAGLRAPLPLTASRDEIFLFDADEPMDVRLAVP